MPELHAKLSPSAAERWCVCPGSVVLSDGLPERTSAFAEEGTEAHWVAEQILNRRPVKADPNMLQFVQTYTDYVEELYREGEVKLIEQKVEAVDGCWGTADAIVWQPATATLHIVDLKYGAGVGVEVSNNLQLKIYALAALRTTKFKAKTVVATIVQPRFPHPDGPIRSKEYDVVDLIDFHADLMDAVKRVELARLHSKPGAVFVVPDPSWTWYDEYLHPSEKGCRWCLAAPTCPKLKTKSQELAKQVFAAGVQYSPEALAHTLDMLPVLEGWIKNVREFAYEEAEKGNAIPGYKLVEKRATRKWRDESAAVMALDGAGIDPYEKKIISPAVAEKALGKADRALLDELTVKESSGHTLVHDSDKRDAVRIDAKAAFTPAG